MLLSLYVLLQNNQSVDEVGMLKNRVKELEDEKEKLLTKLTESDDNKAIIGKLF